MERRPLSPREIIRIAIANGWIASSGATPSQTLKAKLSTDILRRAKRSRFMRIDKNLFVLREWSEFKEYVAERYQKALLDEDIVVFDASLLPRFFPDPGVTHLSVDDGLELIGNTYAMQRLEAESRFDVIQLVSQFLVVHQSRVATYKRTKRLPESRLHGVRSLLFGGHLNPDDIAPLFSPFDPDSGHWFIRRELSEEVRIEGGQANLELVGGIYDPRTEVSEQHVGVLYVVRVPDEAQIQIGERGFLQQLAFQTPRELALEIDEYENWSELVWRTLLASGALKL